MKYKSLYHTAHHIDRLIDNYIHLRGVLFPTQTELKKLLLEACPDLLVKSSGWHKLVFGIRSLDEKIVLKVGAQKSIESDHRAYKRVPESVRHQLFARIYWHTKYCLLQEYGSPAHVTSAQLGRIRRIVYKYGVFDVKAENLKTINGTLRIIDANSTRIPLPTVIRKIDETKWKLPDRLVSAIRRINEIYQK